MVLMNEQALEAQGVAALGVKRKIFKTFEVIRRKMIRLPRRTAGGELVAVLDARTGRSEICQRSRIITHRRK